MNLIKKATDNECNPYFYLAKEKLPLIDVARAHC